MTNGFFPQTLAKSTSKEICFVSVDLYLPPFKRTLRQKKFTLFFWQLFEKCVCFYTQIPFRGRVTKQHIVKKGKRKTIMTITHKKNCFVL